MLVGLLGDAERGKAREKLVGGRGHETRAF
jgi:hypothetical protein